MEMAHKDCVQVKLKEGMVWREQKMGKGIAQLSQCLCGTGRERWKQRVRDAKDMEGDGREADGKMSEQRALVQS